MSDARTLRQVVACAMVVAAIAACPSCGKRPGETPSARKAGKAAAAPSAGSASRFSIEPETNTFEHPALQEQLVHERWRGDLDGIVSRRILRVLVAPNKLGFYFDGSEIRGALYEFCREFEHFLNRKLHTGNLAIHLVFVPIGRDNLLPKLAEGYGDLVATLMVRSNQPQYAVDFTDSLFDDARAVIVSGTGEQLLRIEDLSGREVYYFSNTIPYENLRRLSADFVRDGKPPIHLIPAAPDLQVEDLLEMVNAGLIPLTLAEDKLAQYWAQVLPNLKIQSHLVVADSPLAWAVQQNTPRLKAVINEFIRDHKIGTLYGNTVKDKYLSRVPWVKDAIAGEDLAHFEEMVRLFRKYGDKYQFPYLLLAAQGYQESGLNPRLRSRAGAVGVMQIKPSTAAADPIDITGIEKIDRNIEAGAKYLRHMVSHYYAKEPMDQITRGLFALASYNAGPDRIERLRSVAAAEGYDPNLWFNNVEFIAARRIGAETTNYVSNVYKYYLAYKMTIEQDARRQASRSGALPGKTR
uniref:Lytic transglycosylase, catalytic n=1 Tax=Solibacter usitatus (strain Ellin6076) TaxID=234267 RepID=Q025D7_SOLUE